ncbi:uncharacterized protein [Choristoneura fumiferana]|uniref:uncharacterized protein n=1 Tax=Choristoneura fumiferana TaxID=7141 RepID=UPI003D159F56
MKNCESGHRKPSMPVGLAKKRVKRQADLNPPGRNNIKGVYPFGTSSLLTATNNTNARRFWIPVLKAAIWSAKAAAKAVATHTVKKAAKEAVKKVKKEAVKKAKKEFKKKAKEEAKKRAKEEAEEIIAEEAEEIAEDIEERSKHIGEIAKQIEERAKKIKEVRNVMKLNAKSVKPGKNDKDDQNNLNRLKLKKPKQSRKPPTKKPKPRPTKAKPTKPRRTKAKPTKPKPTKVKPTVPKPTKPTINQGGSHDIELPVEESKEIAYRRESLDREEDNEYSQLKKKRPTRRTTKKKPKPTKPKTMKPKTTTPKHIETTKNSSGSKNINVSVDVSIEVVHPTEKSTQEDGLTLEEGIVDDNFETTVPVPDDDLTSDTPTKVPNDDEDTTDTPSDGEDTTVPDLSSDPSDPDDNNATKVPTGENGSDFDSQMKKFDEEMKKFHDEFHKEFPNVDTGDGYSKKLVKKTPLNPKDAAAKLQVFHDDIAELEKDVQNLGLPFSAENPRISNTEEVGQILQEEEDEQSPTHMQGDENDEKENDEGAEETVEDQKSPENPDVVMPPPGGGVKQLTGDDDKNIHDNPDDKNIGEDVLVDYEEETADEDLKTDENGDDNGEDIMADKTDGGGDVNNDDNGAAENNDEGEKGDNKTGAEDINISKNDKEEDNLPQLTLGDWHDYTGECPKECPSRDVMLCARCVHDIYRTFLSSCHLRMFACEQPEEKLQLVSWTSCAASAPFLTDLSDSAKRVTEANDDDAVLRFVYCRMKGLDGGKSPAAFKGTNAKCDIAAA